MYLVRYNDKFEFVNSLKNITNLIDRNIDKIAMILSKQDLGEVAGKAISKAKELGFINKIKGMILNAKNNPSLIKNIISGLKERIRLYGTVASTYVKSFFIKLYMLIIKMLMASYEMEQKEEKESKSKNSESSDEKDKIIKNIKEQLESYNKKSSQNDSASSFRDCYILLHQVMKIHDCLVKKKLDARTRISRTAKPSQWEIRYVLGVKPGVNYVSSEWKAYRENGYVVVKNKNNGTEYKKPFNEVVQAANQEAASKANNVNQDYIAGMYHGYGNTAVGPGNISSEGSASNTTTVQNGIYPQEKSKLRMLMLKITDLLKILTGMVIAFKGLKSAGATARNIRDFVYNTVTYISKVVGIKKDLDQQAA